MSPFFNKLRLGDFNLTMNDPTRALDASGHYMTPKVIGGSGAPTVGGVTQLGATWDVDGGFHSAPMGNFGFNPYGSMDRIGNAKDENGNVIMAPPAANSAPGMGSLDSFYEWQTSGMPFFGPQSNSGASGRSAGSRTVNWVTAHPDGLAGGDNPFESGEQARLRLFGIPMRFAGGPVKAGEPVIVGEKGPEVIIPKEDGDVIPNKGLYSADDISRRRRNALKSGDFHSYLNMLLFNPHAPSYAA